MNKVNQDQKLENEFARWEESQMIGEYSGDSELVVKCVLKQIECLKKLDRVTESRKFLENILSLVDLGQPKIREMINDAYVEIDDVDYYFAWYQQNLFSREPNEGDQILIYALLCHNRNNDARNVFDKIFPVLSKPAHLVHALRHIPKLIQNQNQREVYYRAILERSKDSLTNISEPSSLSVWYEILLQAQYCLNDVSGFDETVTLLSKINPDSAKKHLDFLDRLRDRSNPQLRRGKIFGIGLSKTGTSSLSKALTLLGFSTAHWTNPYSHDLLTQDDIILFDSLTDISISYQYKEIYNDYSDAKFILTSRSIEQWERSFLTHYRRSMHANSFEDLKKIIGTQIPPRFSQRYVEMHQKLYFQYKNLSEAYLAHEKSVLNFFEKKRNQLLVLDVSQPGALNDMASFLGVQSPQSNFPHENTKEVKGSWVSPLSAETRNFMF